MNAFVISVADKPGELARITGAIAEKGINITSVIGLGMAGQGAVAVITNDEPGTRSALSEIGQVREIELIPVTLDDRPGTLAAATRKLANAGINIELVLPISLRDGKATAAFATSDNARARELLTSGVLASA